MDENRDTMDMPGLPVPSSASAPQQFVPPSPAAEDIMELANAAERRVESIVRIKLAAIRVTNAGDWVDEGGRPYLQASGAEKIARCFGVSWQIEEPRRETFPDGHFAYICRGKFTLGRASIDAIGYRESRDPFFSSRWRDGERVTLPPSEIDRGNVMRAAYTNCLANGITRILGIRNLSWDELAPLGINPDRRVTYSKKPSSEATGERPATQAQIRYMMKLLDDAGVEADRRTAYVSEIIGEKITELNKITLNQAQRIIETMRGGHQ